MVAIIWISVVSGGCESSEAVTSFHDLLATQGEVVFLSWDGEWIGTDVDTDLTFKPGGVVQMTMYGYAVSHYRGTYTIDSDGFVSVRFEDFERAWPLMVMEKDEQWLRLRPRDPNHAAVILSNAWPFRQVERRPFDFPASQPSE